MVENEDEVIELEEMPFYTYQKSKLERIKGTCQINSTCKEIIKWNGVFASAGRNNPRILEPTSFGEQ